MATTTKKQIETALKELCEVSGEFNNSAAAIAAGKKHFIAYEDAPVYGGCRLIAIDCVSGGHYGAFGMSSTSTRLKKGEFLTQLQALTNGILYAQGKTSNAIG